MTKAIRIAEATIKNPSNHASLSSKLPIINSKISAVTTLAATPSQTPFHIDGTRSSRLPFLNIRMRITTSSVASSASLNPIRPPVQKSASIESAITSGFRAP